MAKGKTIKKMCRKAALNLKRVLPGVLAGAAACGTIVTAVLSAKATVKAVQLCEKATAEKGRELTKQESVRVAAPAYIPTVAAGFATIGCILGAHVLNKKQKVYLAGLCAAQAVLSKNRGHTQQETPEDNSHALVDAKESLFLFCEPSHIGYFTRTKEEVIKAEYDLNRLFILIGYVSLNDFCELLKIDKVPGGDDIGWSIYAGDEVYGYEWIDFQHTPVRTDDGLDCIIVSMGYDPAYDYMG